MGLEEGEIFAVRRELGAGDFGVAEEDFAVNERG
jgi:hypothetical protein